MIKHQQAYQISELTEWEATIHQAIELFEQQKGVYPNVFECNTETGSKFDHLVNHELRMRNHLSFPAGMEIPKPSHELVLTGFHSEQYSLQIATDEDLPDLAVRLIYDDAPEWDRPAIKASTGVSLNLVSAYSDPRSEGE